jgi:hypothetical protein
MAGRPDSSAQAGSRVRVLAALSAATCRSYSATLFDQPRSFDRRPAPRMRRPKMGSDRPPSIFLHWVAFTSERYRTDKVRVAFTADVSRPSRLARESEASVGWRLS